VLTLNRHIEPSTWTMLLIGFGDWLHAYRHKNKLALNVA
jgi:hypothetical protein